MPLIYYLGNGNNTGTNDTIPPSSFIALPWTHGFKVGKGNNESVMALCNETGLALCIEGGFGTLFFEAALALLFFLLYIITRMALMS